MVQTSWQLPAAGSAWNEPATILTTKECTTVEERITETNSKAKVRGLKSYYLSDIHLRPGTAWNWASTDRLDNEGTYLCRGPSYGDKFQGGCETIDSCPPISLTHIWIQESSENCTEVVPSAAQYFFFSWPLSSKSFLPNCRYDRGDHLSTCYLNKPPSNPPRQLREPNHQNGSNGSSNSRDCYCVVCRALGTFYNYFLLTSLQMITYYAYERINQHGLETDFYFPIWSTVVIYTTRPFVSGFRMSVFKGSVCYLFFLSILFFGLLIQVIYCQFELPRFLRPRQLESPEKWE